MDAPITAMPQKGERWQHHGGKLYDIIVVANLEAIDRDKFPVVVVYTDHEHVWARSAAKFVQKFTKVTR